MFLLRILIYIAVAVLVLVIFHFVLAIHPPRFRSNMTPSDLGLPYETVYFTTTDNVTLAGWFIPSQRGLATILICHGYPFDKGNVLPLSRFLHNRYHLLLFDFRYFGQSRGQITTVGYRETKDVLAAIRYLEQRGDVGPRIGAWGFSMGAAALIMADTEAIDGIVADSSYAEVQEMVRRTYWLFPGPVKIPFVALTNLFARIFLQIDIDRESPLLTIQEGRTPVLFIHGERDTQIPLTESTRMYETSKHRGDIDLWVVPKADHGQAHALYPEEYESRVLQFFEEHLVKPEN